LSHDHGSEVTSGESNHLKVKEFAKFLQGSGVTSWIDDTNNSGNMKITIADGIAKSRKFIAFLTSNYNEKMKKGVDEKDWCFYEFNYATYILRPKDVILCVFEKEMKDRNLWAPFLQAEFANRLYFDVSDPDDLTAWSALICHIRE
jgi:hypothetical protein